MNHLTHRFSPWLVLILLSLAFLSPACKSKKKLAEEKARQEAEAMKKEKETYLSQLEKFTRTPIRDMEEWEERYADFQSLADSHPFSDDVEVKATLAKVEAFFQSEKKRLEEAMMEEEEKTEESSLNSALMREVEDYFERVAKASGYEAANRLIDQALPLFSSTDSPILIVIDQKGEDRAYDRPTTAEKYLNYLKDRGEYRYRVAKINVDDEGKISSLELKKD